MMVGALDMLLRPIAIRYDGAKALAIGRGNNGADGFVPCTSTRTT